LKKIILVILALFFVGCCDDNLRGVVYSPNCTPTKNCNCQKTISADSVCGADGMCLQNEIGE
jgi:hypothetical protein